ncbi:MAG: hypothetical protein ACI39U_09175, partial [Candidatus Cryptobacteroides sp.]
PVYLNPEANGNDLLFLAVHEFECYQLQNPFLLDDFLSEMNAEEDKNASETTDKEELKDGNYDVIPVEIEEDAEYLNTKLAAFVDWANENVEPLSKAAASPSSSFDGKLSEYIEDSKFSQHITKTFNVGADGYQICKVLFSDPDKVTRHSTVDLKISITPLYAYSQTNKESEAGDYYFIFMEVISHNGPLYGIYKTWHGAVRTYAHVFYSDKIKFDANLCTPSSESISDGSVSFFETPQPQSTQSSTTYTVGFSKSFNVSAQGGFSVGKPAGNITVGGTWTWSKSYSKTIADQSIIMNSNSSLGVVSYQFITNNLQWEDETEAAIPAIARSDQKCEASWCWRVSGNRDDDNDTYYRLHLYLNPTYGCQWRHATWTAEGDRKSESLMQSGDMNLYVDLLPPNRTRNGVIKYVNTTDNYVYGFKIMDASGNVVAKGDTAYEKDSVQQYQLPVGTYNLEYDVLNGNTGKLIGHYKINDAVVTTSNTTGLSHLDAVVVQK